MPYSRYDDQESDAAVEGRPPILGSWSQLYTLVIVLHAILIIAFYFLTKHYT